MLARMAQTQGTSLAPQTSPRPQPNPRRGAPSVDEFMVEAVIQDVMAVVPRDLRELGQSHVAQILMRAAWDLIENHRQVAYILATAEHESSFGNPRFDRSEPLVEDHNPYRQDANGNWRATNHVSGRGVTGDSHQDIDENYWDDSYGGRLGNERDTADAADFRGRGYVQLTFRDNYRAMSDKLRDEGFTYFLDGVTWGRQDSPIDLEAHPEHVNRSEALAAKIMASGMMDGDFTGRDLPRYVDEDSTDYRNARRTVNGTDEADSIASRARVYEGVLAGVWPQVFWRQGDDPR